MNDVIRITSDGAPNPQQPQLPLPISELGEPPLTVYSPEFWLAVPTCQQLELISEFEKHELEYRIYEIVDSEPLVSRAVCRSWLPYPETGILLLEICNHLLIDGFVVSNGSLTSIDANGDLQGFIDFD